MDPIKIVKQIKRKDRVVKLNYSYLHLPLQKNKNVKYAPWTTLVVVIYLVGISKREPSHEKAHVHYLVPVYFVTLFLYL